jgi:hypothetical protein
MHVGNVCNSCKSSPCLASFCSAFLCCLGFSLHILLPLYTNISSDIDHILYSYTSLRMSSIARNAEQNEARQGELLQELQTFPSNDFRTKFIRPKHYIIQYNHIIFSTTPVTSKLKRKATHV